MPKLPSNFLVAVSLAVILLLSSIGYRRLYRVDGAEARMSTQLVPLALKDLESEQAVIHDGRARPLAPYQTKSRSYSSSARIRLLQQIHASGGGRYRAFVEDLLPRRIQVDGDTASMAASITGNLSGIRDQPALLTFYFQRVSGHWRLTLVRSASDSPYSL